MSSQSYSHFPARADAGTPPTRPHLSRPYAAYRTGRKSVSLFPSQPGCLLLKRNGNALQARNGRETDIEHRNDMLTWRKPKPLLDTWIIGRVPCAPHTSESQLFSSQQHILDSRSRSLDILDLQHLWLVGRFSHYYNDYGRA